MEFLNNSNMEENKKEINEAEIKAGLENKMSYEQLSDMAWKLNEQVNTLYKKLQESNLYNTFKRLDYLFKVMEYSHMFDDSFVKDCTEEIKELIVIPKESDMTEKHEQED